jgi:hypothetical protein
MNSGTGLYTTIHLNSTKELAMEKYSRNQLMGVERLMEKEWEISHSRNS